MLHYSDTILVLWKAARASYSGDNRWCICGTHWSVSRSESIAGDVLYSTQFRTANHAAGPARGWSSSTLVLLHLLEFAFPLPVPGATCPLLLERQNVRNATFPLC